MAEFESLFRQSNGKPIEYNGETVFLYDRVPIEDNQVISVVFESAHGEWRQGIVLSTDGSIKVNGQEHPEVVLWQDSAPSEVLLSVHTKKQELLVMNAWDTGNGLMHRCHNGAAMLIEIVENGRRYKCNDGLPDDDFDDLVFRLEIHPSA